MAEESKTRETIRYLGYSFGVVGGMILVILLYLVLAPLMDIIMLIVTIAGLLFLVVLAGASVFYLFIQRER